MNKKTKAFYGRKIAAMIAEGSGYTQEAHAVVRLAESLTRLPSDDLYFLDLLVAIKNGTYTRKNPTVESIMNDGNIILEPVGPAYAPLPNAELIDAMHPPLSEILKARCCSEPNVMGGRCTNCGTWSEDAPGEER